MYLLEWFMYLLAGVIALPTFCISVILDREKRKK
jgi:hypothetical protein